ncbi:MAG: response regulator, partial [Deltaproteobacteria bacterium]|nr:response regulator [Deltaproteobacteria bacterium]
MTATKTKLLVVEDDPHISAALAEYGRRKGFEVAVADDGIKAVQLGIAERPAVILLDVMLPGKDGRDVLAELSRAGVAQNAIVIFVTARDSQSDRLVGLELGAVEYETKPLHFQVLFHKI